MENHTFIPEDYDKLLKQYILQKTNLNEVKQTLYETSRQLKVNEALLTEYQSDIELLQYREQSQNQKFETKIANLEEIISNLRSCHSKNTSDLETELEKQERENNELKSQIELLKRKNEVELDGDNSINLNELSTLTNEKDLLLEKIQELEAGFMLLRSQNSKLEEALEEYKEELCQVKESLKLKREELLENATLIEKLNDELLCANRELDNYKHTPLEADSKGNSLFAEVDDRRVHLQETINQMKSGYIQLKQEHGQHVKLIAELRKENYDLRDSWKKDLEEVQNDKFWVNETLTRHIKALEERLEDQKKQLEVQSVTIENDMPKDVTFYDQMINDKCKEINEWKEKYSNKSVNEFLMSRNLAEANKTVRLLRLEVQQLKAELRETKAHMETQVSEKSEVLCHKCKIRDQRISRFEIDENRKLCTSQERMPIKGCLKPKKEVLENDLTLIVSNPDEVKKDGGFNIFGNVARYTVTERKPLQSSYDTSYTTVEPMEKAKRNTSPNTAKVLISFGDKENIDSNIKATSAEEKKGVTFSEDTVDPVGNPTRRRGTHVFIMPKKSDAGNTSNI